ncbi:EscI/YscI/HrpB family type III secretion system inner rod protein [Pseudomonas reactans]|uniref:EscI/YscI/HrpB family type III secretion system inner rod protein n=1 Tax=Pseudomonas reactans TaxID=117680 RepID=UPI0015A0608C|nr:EscI/YscI/HrpB family type III secretion system inner rod protein [Pseudomonas reactans]NWA65560.1 type III secretion apparatus protein RspB [Pseudomonas reactans]
MQIKEYDFSAQHRVLQSNAATQAESTSNTDAGFFSSMLEQSKPNGVSSAPHSPMMLTEVAQQLKSKESRLVRALKSTNKGADPDDFRQYPRELSNVVLTSQLLVKSLAKATQSIDKISNLQ